MVKKRIITICFIFLCLIGFIVWEQITVKLYFNDVMVCVQTLEEQAKDTPTLLVNNIQSNLIKLENKWNHHEKILSMLINYKDIKDVGIEISKLKANMEVDQSEDFLASIEVIIYLLKSYEKLIETNIESII